MLSPSIRTSEKGCLARAFSIARATAYCCGLPLPLSPITAKLRVCPATSAAGIEDHPGSRRHRASRRRVHVRRLKDVRGHRFIERLRERQRSLKHSLARRRAAITRDATRAVSYTHLRARETPEHL